jgi:hypothetical protein
VEICTRLISEELFETVPCGYFATIKGAFSLPFPANVVEVFAKIGHVLLSDRVGASIATLVRDATVVTDAVEADFQISAALMAGFGAAGQSGEVIFPPAAMAMTRDHSRILARASLAASHFNELEKEFENFAHVS